MSIESHFRFVVLIGLAASRCSSEAGGTVASDAGTPEDASMPIAETGAPIAEGGSPDQDGPPTGDGDAPTDGSLPADAGGADDGGTAVNRIVAGYYPNWTPSPVRIRDVDPHYNHDGPGLAVPTYVENSIDDWVKLVGETHLAVGFGIANLPNYMTIADAVSTWKAVAAKHPNLRGAFDWQIHADEGDGWPFAKQIGPLVSP